jgi:hypothetical protein
MSWSKQVTLDMTGDVDVSAKLAAVLPAGQTDLPDEVSAQNERAEGVALLLIDSPVFANAAELSVTLSGHANPEHKAQPGSYGDTITVSVHISKYRES